MKFMGEAEIAPCPSSEVLAAFIDNGLSLAERARAWEHLARCDRCREVVAAVMWALEQKGVSDGK